MVTAVLKIDNKKIVSVSRDRANETVINLFKNNISRNLMYMLYIAATKKPTFLILNAKKAFNHLKQMFIKALILWHFDWKSHIQIKNNILGYLLYKVLSQLNLNSNVLSNNLGPNKSNFC